MTERIFSPLEKQSQPGFLVGGACSVRLLMGRPLKKPAVSNQRVFSWRGL
jgi:hypothetical protein